ncbi:MAG: hypothetical protein PWQ63_1676 [Methanolobus sp.]|jgi:hypothetical protein|nr:hypothetical protein [Methanolobus sp.]
MNINMYAILILVGMAFFILSFFVKNKEDRFIVTIMSALSSFVMAACSCWVELVTNEGIVINISEAYALGLTFFFMAIVQFLRAFYVSYEQLDGEYK